ncbi:FadR family transcriptional regulator [Vibrio sp.]|uniref:FadR family transcriptional regulator n=1 Tax=Vibrio viridaestus TaxID=2487322 RepID=A0A3N9TKX1_9VIBR|nr:FadR/GntR family transcriptional regulator [Vibrio viridaestus]MDC0611733.1 FadR family transcriptional regulator [Vibrio sp.]RQW64513.1 FadR family transcriptional regulator [Vibrio viridaestus]
MNKALQPINVKRTDTLVLDELTRYVANNNIQQGQKLPAERELAIALQVSRNTVREALKEWEALGIVTKVKGSGTYLTSDVTMNDSHLSLRFKNDSENMLHALELRRIIEVEANCMAAKRATDDQIVQIEKQLVVMEKAHILHGSAGREDWEFHLSIYEASGNPLVIHIIAAFYDSLHAFFESPIEQALFSDSFPLHRKLYEAIAARDIELTRAVSHSILDITERDMREIIHG